MTHAIPHIIALRVATLALAACLLLRCGGENGPPEPTIPAHCNPLVGEGCLLPWPSTFLLQRDPSTATGYRVSYPAQGMPQNNSQVAIDPSRYNLLDGFSIGSQIVVAFKGGVGADGLPPQDNLAGSITAQSLVWLLEMDSGARVPLFAEVDANARQPDELPALIIRPQVPLRWNTRYAVALRVGLRDASGAALQPPDPFRRLRDTLGTRSKTLQGEATRIEEVLSFLEGKGLPRAGVLLAWDFQTASREGVTGNLVQMVDDAMARLPATGPEVSSLKVTEMDAAAEPDLLRQIEGTMAVPSYLASESPDSWLTLDGAGRPVYRAPQKFPFIINIPRCAEKATGPLPILIFGHGVFGWAPRELGEAFHKTLGNRLCMVEVATNWIGMTERDVAAIIKDVVLDFSNLPRVTDQLHQAHVNQQALVRLMQGALLQDAALQVGGKPVTDGKELYYLGLSNGGMHGTVHAALSTSIERYALNVTGGWYSMLMPRSADFEALALLLERVYIRATDRALVLGLSQHLWDPVDPICYTEQLLATPLPGRGKKRLLVQEARHDGLVPNMTTRAIVRAVGLPLLTPSVEPVFGVSEKSGPLDSAYVQWDTRLPDNPPTGNVPPPKRAPKDEPHDVVRNYESCVKQWQTFLGANGRVVNTCDGACDPE
jgi:hypothetical protein